VHPQSFEGSVWRVDTQSKAQRHGFGDPDFAAMGLGESLTQQLASRPAFYERQK
jgi:hypothetical protein